MDKKDQIEEMAILIRTGICLGVHCEMIATVIYEGGYQKQEWISVEDHLPDEAGEYLVVYHPCYWDNVQYDKVRVGMDTFRGKSAWAHRKFQRVTHWMPMPEPPTAEGGDEP